MQNERSETLAKENSPSEVESGMIHTYMQPSSADL